jgi:hypothetical protein
MRRGPNRKIRVGPRCGGGHSKSLRFSSETFERGRAAAPLGVSGLKFGPRRAEERLHSLWRPGTDGKHSCGPGVQKRRGNPPLLTFLALFPVQHAPLHAAGDGHDLTGHVPRELVRGEHDDLAGHVLRLRDLA